ncbi:MAG: tRNA lysidine(34) synthetase TilS [Dehalococcoidia bacterium]
MRRSEDTIPMKRVELGSRVLEFIRRHNLVSAGETVVVGVSGGADSVCLLHILAKWQEKLGTKLHAAHLNHQLRGLDSEADAKYVSNLAHSLGIPITIDKQDAAARRMAKHCSIEEAGRELRYAFLARVAAEVGSTRIAVGHTRDDHVETILMHILRGSGITGLCGLAPCSPMVYDNQRTSWEVPVQSLPGNLLVIRPLLDITREETTSYCQEHQLNPRIDSSNLSLSFFRNRLRLELLPLLRRYNPGVDQALVRLADIAREDNAFLEQEAEQLWDELARQENSVIYLDKKRIARLPVALQRQLLRAAVTKLAGDSRDIEAVHIEVVRGLLNKPVGRRVCLPHGLVCQGGYNELLLSSARDEQERSQSQLPLCPLFPLPDEFNLKVPGQTGLPGWKVVASVVQKPTGEEQEQPLAFCHSGGSEESHRAGDTLGQAVSAHFDLHKTGTELFVRKRRPGDRFQPLGMDMPKKLYKFMVAAKIPRSWRDHIPIVCSPQQIVWVVGWRIDDRVKVSQASKEVLRLEFLSSP